MATVRRTRGGNGGAPEAEVTPEEAAKIRSSVGAKEQAPSSREQSLFDNWREAANQLGSPFEVERIPMSKLRAMRRDPMLGFGLSFIKTPIVRARWFINAKGADGPNAQIAAHLDHDLRRIWASYVLQWTNSLDFGFQAIAKRFEFRIPSGTFENVNPDSGERTEEPIWSEGNIDPIAWKTFVALPPEGVEPIWNGQGEFDGIDYKASAAVPLGIGASPRSEGSKKIDLYHALWVTNERDANFGSVFGYPRLGYAYRYWWSYWFRWSIGDRAFEKKADPSVLIYHPEGSFVDPDTGEEIDYATYAIAMGERMRSGGVIALPSEVYEDATGKGTIRQWEIAFTKDATDFDPFDKSFDYLDIQKLRALWIPEQAFLEGKGGTSSRNVAKEMGESFIESQAVLAAQVVESVNRWLIPQWLAVNYPEFVEAQGTAEMLMQGFADEDVEFTKEIIQLIGQQESGMKEVLKLVDLRKVLEDAGTPIATFVEQQRREEQLAQEAAVAAAPTAPAIPGQQVGVVPSATGFGTVYTSDPREVVTLAANGTQFIENLPPTPHYEDITIKGFARQLWFVYRDLYRDEYETAARAISLEASDDQQAEQQVELALDDFKGRAGQLLSLWHGSFKWKAALDRTVEILNRIGKRAAKLELKRANLSRKLDEEDLEDWLREHLVAFSAKVAETTRSEIHHFVAARLAEGVTNRDKLAEMARKHFNEFPDWKADRLVRTEVRDVYNAATLLAAESVGVKTVQALDARFGLDTDQDCVDRNGRLFHVEDAFKETEHPNGTLAWRILPAVELSIEFVDAVPGLPNGKAFYDDDSETVYFKRGIEASQQRDFLLTLGDYLVSSGGQVRPDKSS